MPRPSDEDLEVTPADKRRAALWIRYEMVSRTTPARECKPAEISEITGIDDGNLSKLLNDPDSASYGLPAFKRISRRLEVNAHDLLNNDPPWDILSRRDTFTAAQVTIALSKIAQWPRLPR